MCVCARAEQRNTWLNTERRTAGRRETEGCGTEHCEGKDRKGERWGKEKGKERMGVKGLGG